MFGEPSPQKILLIETYPHSVLGLVLAEPLKATGQALNITLQSVVVKIFNLCSPATFYMYYCVDWASQVCNAPQTMHRKQHVSPTILY